MLVSVGAATAPAIHFPAVILKEVGPLSFQILLQGFLLDEPRMHIAPSPQVQAALMSGISILVAGRTCLFINVSHLV